MIYLTSAAAKQIKTSAKEGNLEGLALRIAVTSKEGELQYGMGFDEFKEGDKKFVTESVEIIISDASLVFSTGMTLDYVEIEKGQYQFIFMNPNDPHYVPPKK